MRIKYIVGILTILMVICLSCKKEVSGESNTSSITIVNAIQNADYIVINFSDTAFPFYQAQVGTYYASSTEYGIAAGKIPLAIVASYDTTQTISMDINLKTATIYSLYLAGIGIPHAPVDTLLMMDTIRTHADSVAGVRFINLSPGSLPITINLQGNLPAQTEFPPLAYKQISNFKTYPDTSGISSYTFEIRDQATGTLLNAFTWTFSLFNNSTLVVCGSEDPNSSNPITVFQVNNF